MPIDINEYREPKWERYRTKYPFSENRKDKFYKFELNTRGYRDGFRQGGYNPNHNATRVERINPYTDDYTLKPY